jgi:ABC-type lipoprotein release transport system permease subunit
MINTLGVLAKLAWRNLWRNRRRTLVMLAAVGFGVWAMIFMTALTQGMVNEMIKDGISTLPGHVQVHDTDYLDDPNVENLIPQPDDTLARIMQSGGFETWSTRVKVPAVVTSERESRGVTLLGIDPEHERAFSFIDYDAVEGRFLDSPDDAGIVLGRKLAETLETEVGKRVVVMSQGLDGDIADRGFRVVGVFDARMEAFENTYVLTGKHTLQAMLGIDGQVSELVVLGDDYRNVEPLLEAVRAEFGDDVAVAPWYELDRYLGAMLSVMDGFVFVWVIVIFLALSFGLVNTLVMAVFERVREIGLMLALGMRPMSILGQIVLESMLLLAIGLAVGNALAWLSIKPLESGIDVSIVAEGMEMMGAASVLYPQLRVEDVMLANVVVLTLGFLASLSPAWRASRYEPIEAITKAD